MEYLDNLVAKHGHRVFSKKNKSIDANNVYIGRGSIFGNPYKMNKETDRIQCVMDYRKYLIQKIKTDPKFVEAIKTLKGKNVVCFCSNGTTSIKDGARYCHGHVLLAAVEYLNQIG